MKSSYLSFFIIFLSIYAQQGNSQPTGGWGNCEFSTIVEMNAFDPSLSPNHCKRAYVQANNKHYFWDGSEWIMNGLNLYNTSDTLTENRVVTMDGKDLTFEGTKDVEITDAGELSIDGESVLLKTANNASSEGMLLAKDNLNFIADHDNDSGSEEFVWGINGVNLTDLALQILMRLAESGQLKLTNYGQATPNFNTGNETYMLAVEPDGDVVEMNTAKAAKIFYPPALSIDVTATATGQTLDLHQEYLTLYSTPAVSSSGAPGAIPTYAEDELYYYLTEFDTAVLDNVSIDANGLMTYDIISVPPDRCAFITMVFVLK